MTSPLGCFLCNALDHWAGNCWTRTPPTSEGHHDARIATYRIWGTETWRVTPQQKRKLIEHENEMWKDVKEKAK